MNDLSGKIPVTYKPFIVPVVGLVLILVLSLTLGQYIWAKIGEEQQKIADLKARNAQLATKANLLAQQDRQLLLSRTQAALNAVPADSPALLALASANNLAGQKGVRLTDFRVTEKKEQKAATIELTLNLEGTLASSLAFLTSMKSTAPLVRVSEIRSTLAEGLARTRLTLAAIWSPLPSDLGSPESPVDALTRPEEEIADKFTQLKQPTSEVIEASPPEGRANPFNQLP